MALALPPPAGAGLPALAAAVRAAGVHLGADRCWLYARDPQRHRGIALVRWVRSPGVADVPDDVRRWTPEAPDLPARDPLFARALAGTPLDAVDDVHGAGVDQGLERALGHRAFVHLNLHDGGALWGTLQPGMVSCARVWTAEEQEALRRVRAPFARAVAALVRRDGEALRSCALAGDGLRA